MVRLHRVTAALALLTSGAAQAADMPSLPPSIPVTPVAPVHWLSAGWYLRGDIGYRWGALNDMTPALFGVDVPGPTDNHLGGAPVGGLGFGIKTKWLRTDLTVDYAGAQTYRGTFAGFEPSAKIQTTSILFNGYFDLGTWYRLTPYVGAGAGGSYVRVSDFLSNLAPPGVPPPDSHSRWNFAWALMAGVGWQVAPSLTVDVGYRYLNVGDVKSDPGAAVVATFKNVAGHEARIGLRWNFDDLRLDP
jgi:opacity protein-like surface antigen